jgi:hypothetical protein
MQFALSLFWAIEGADRHHRLDALRIKWTANPMEI